MGEGLDGCGCARQSKAEPKWGHGKDWDKVPQKGRKIGAERRREHLRGARVRFTCVLGNGVHAVSTEEMRIEVHGCPLRNAWRRNRLLSRCGWEV